MLFCKCFGERKQQKGRECGPPAGPSRAEMTEGLGDTGTTAMQEPTQTSAFHITEAHLSTYAKLCVPSRCFQVCV